ncbi:hypothetical protein C8J57DRAFT_1079801, partial [Mycena rebaudengoi]
LEDWCGACDIIQCSPCFHQHKRYNSLLVNMTDPGLHFARTYTLLRRIFPSGRQIDVAIVRMFELCRWKPKKIWAGCQMCEEGKEYTLLSMEDVIRGALLAPVSSSPNEPIRFVVDTVDVDMFLRADM